MWKRALLFLLFFSTLAQAQYYADVTFDVLENGDVRIDGTSNHPHLSPGTYSALTSKKDGIWLLNLTLPEEHLFSDYVFEIKLPDRASINYVNTKGQIGMEAVSERMVISGIGQDSRFKLLVQYSIKEEYIEEGGLGVVALLIFVLVLLGTIYLKTRSKKEVLDGLTERQVAIYDIVKNGGDDVNQTLVCEKLSLAKSSVSRNVETLVKKGYIEKENVGMNTFLKVKKQKE